MKDYIIRCTDEQGVFYISGDTRFGYQTTEDEAQARIHQGNDLTFRNVSEYYKHLKPEQVEVLTLSKALTVVESALEEGEIFVGVSRYDVTNVNAFVFDIVNKEARLLEISPTGTSEVEMDGATSIVWSHVGSQIVQEYFPEDYDVAYEKTFLKELQDYIPNQMASVSRKEFNGWMYHIKGTELKTIVINNRR